MERRKTRKTLCGIRLDLEVIRIVMVRCARVCTQPHLYRYRNRHECVFMFLCLGRHMHVYAQTYVMKALYAYAYLDYLCVCVFWLCPLRGHRHSGILVAKNITNSQILVSKFHSP